MLGDDVLVIVLAGGAGERLSPLMKERAKFMAGQPGFVSVSLHRSEDGTHVVNYLQWTDKERLAAAHHSPEFRKKWPKFGELVQDVEPALYDVVLTEAA